MGLRREILDLAYEACMLEIELKGKEKDPRYYRRNAEHSKLIREIQSKMPKDEPGILDIILESQRYLVEEQEKLEENLREEYRQDVEDLKRKVTSKIEELMKGEIT